MEYEIVVTNLSDNPDIEAIIAMAFGDKRHDRLINRLRKECEPYYLGCFIARADKVILGSIRCYLTQAKSGELLPCLGPLAVLPHIRGIGIGKSLIKTSLEKLQLKHKGAIIVGDNGYYAPFGFSAKTVDNLQLGGSVAPLTFMGLEWQKNYISNSHGQIAFIKKPPTVEL